MDANLTTMPIVQFIIYSYEGSHWEGQSFDDAENELSRLRSENPNNGFKLLAEIDA